VLRIAIDKQWSTFRQARGRTVRVGSGRYGRGVGAITVSPMQRTLAPWVIGFAGRAFWIISAGVWLFYLLALRTDAYLLDYHVHAGAAWDLLDGSLYRAELTYPGRLPIDRFNYPPLAAAIAVPFALLPEAIGGSAWLLLNIVGIAIGFVLFARLLGAHPGWAGIGFGLYTIHPFAPSLLHGNINPLMIGVVMAFAVLHVAGRDRWAGIALAIAIGLKLWPFVFVPLLLRERRWTTLAVAAGAIAIQGLLTIAWLGLDVIGPMLADLTYRLPPEPDDYLLNPWPAWAGYLVAVGLLLVPARGRLGIGLAMLAGMAVVPNLWHHYLPTIVIGAVLVLRAALDNRPQDAMSDVNPAVPTGRHGAR
jgi:hypothetical protein